ncbi:hypothetical protein [Nocardia stercoris]|uniref:Uncharacterized protein n=1 Tax=Nocardia stercoris TaxID=2483361 RepID=A0A3M2LD40_9NOCA|nr:hypothetical protein [Nocardia stercoris]RMI32608.1 hypothetical protein EBN03_11550 [Nocardia stercoris]
MTETSTGRKQLEAALGAGPDAVAMLSDDQCADLLSLLDAAPARDRALAEAELARNLAREPRALRFVLRVALLRRRRRS